MREVRGGFRVVQMHKGNSTDTSVSLVVFHVGFSVSLSVYDTAEFYSLFEADLSTLLNYVSHPIYKELVAEVLRRCEN